MSDSTPSVARMRAILRQISAGGRPCSSSSYTPASPPSPPLALSPATRWNGWGFQDTKLFVNADKLIEISGARYAEVFANAPDRTLPALLPWAEKRLGLDADRGSPPSITHPEQLALRNELPEDGEAQRKLLQLLHVASEELGLRTSTSVEERVRHGHGQTCEDVFRLRHVKTVERVPDAVLWPTSHEQVEALVQEVARNFASFVCIIPFGGGTNVTNALECDPSERRAIVSLDMGDMRRILSVDRENMLAVVEAGITGLELHERLRHRGLTLGHEPDSWEFSTLGGWVATRASGMKKNTYGNIEDLVVNITTVTPQGTMQRSANVPRAAMGPDMNNAMMGSEGIFGVHTLVTLRLREFPEVQVYDSLIFPSLEHGLAALKEITRAGCEPASLRLLDNTQFQLGQALKTSSTTNKFAAGVLDFAKKTYVTKIRGFDVNEMCAATVLLEGTSQQKVAEQQKRIQVIAKRHEGMVGGEENGKRGYFFTYIIAYLRDFALDYYFMSESFETSVPWTNARQVITDIKLAINSVAAKRNVKVPPLIACRISQVYETGVCVYVYYGINYYGIKEPLTLFRETELAAVDAIVRNGGALSHHHGVGKHRLAWLPQAVSPPAIAAIQGIKTALDPANVFAVTNLQPSKNHVENKHQN
ncbi:Alkyldihydroxyacetonephosphate synthase, peroxisomal [Phytophthora cinnamomi]|uniref:Alkyldihydroxyacetonephosphate synthase, peroxisomal n=1 Tax=Phytophthora cinnamomi TaxID=4785 RepID=UPI003559EDF3|nr:Alkyldihydroxyacetonephosphate synthase, peroxisomal [Phytophthora cinnamomi]